MSSFLCVTPSLPFSIQLSLVKECCPLSFYSILILLSCSLFLLVEETFNCIRILDRSIRTKASLGYLVLLYSLHDTVVLSLTLWLSLLPILP